MKSELFVDVQPKEISIALLEDSRLVSLQKESRNIVYAVGDFYLAKVKKLMPGLNAAFVDVGYEKDAFLHYLDLGPQFNTYNAFITEALEHPETVPEISSIEPQPEIPKQGRIAELLQPGKQLLVQIAKEPISTKGPRLTTELTLTGRFMVLIPFGNKISISQKIKSTEEKVRLRQIISSIKPKGFGVIVRTSAEGKKVAELINELRALVEAWKNSIAKMQRSTPPSLIYEEESRAVSVIRDIFNPSFESVYVNDAEIFEQIQKYVSLIAPDRKEIVKLYTKDVPIFDSFNITRQIKSAFGKTVSFKSGAYLIIEHTEALHVIDVNSGNRSKASQDQETNALEVNLRAADEIARQLRLRDMGGIIVVDFIDMAKSEHRQQLLDHMRDNMAKDRARHNILPLSKFGLMQITRQRVRPALDITTEETCPSCFGKGEVQPSLLFTDKLEEKLEYLTEQLEVKKFILYIHPFVEAYVKKGMFSLYGKWKRRFGRGLKVVADESLAYLQYRVIDSTGQEIFLHEESDMNSAQSKNKTRSERLLEDEPSADGSKKDSKKDSKIETKTE
ncbi:MAG: Rne/Rng family ribonuclease [Muribaculaceae bacterium]|nr:Rne/Rng family ribonuclease [Muribaculaceae bacterium]